MTMFQQNFKNNVKDEVMRDKRFVENFKMMIEMTIDLKNKLYKQIIKQ